MTATSQGKGRSGTMTKTGTIPRTKPAKRRNAEAAALADPRYRARVVGRANVYNRKKKTKPGEDDDA